MQNVRQRAYNAAPRSARVSCNINLIRLSCYSPVKAISRVHWHSTHAHHAHAESTSLWKRVLGISAHAHHHHHVLPVAAPKDGQPDEGRRITLIGFGSNIGLTITKAFAGLHYHSESLLADAGHSMSDILSDIVTLLTLSLSRKTSERFPDRAKFDALGSVLVSGLLFSGASVMAAHSVSNLLQVIQSSDAVTIDHHLTSPTALYIACATIAIKELLFRATMKVAKKTGNSVLISSAWHHRADSLSTLVAVAGIGCSSLLGVPWADPLGGLAVSALLLRTSISNASAPLLSLLDYAPPPDPRINDTLNKALSICNEDGLARTLVASRLVSKNGKSTLYASIAFPAGTTLDQVELDRGRLQEAFRESEEYKYVVVVIRPEVQK